MERLEGMTLEECIAGAPLSPRVLLDFAVQIADAAYQDFFALGEHADPDIQILKQAKAEYANLQ